MNEEYWGLNGALTEECNEVLAKKLVREVKGKILESFFVKKVTSGRDAGQFYNPWGMFATPGAENRNVPSRGQNLLEYTKVPKESYENYLKFLSTRNSVYLNTAMRASNNGSK